MDRKKFIDRLEDAMIIAGIIGIVFYTLLPLIMYAFDDQFRRGFAEGEFYMLYAMWVMLVYILVRIITSGDEC
jgi:hypothetical protein